MNIYQDFLSFDELQFLTGRKQKERIKEQLNLMGISFVENAHGYPVVRRDYSQIKTKTRKQTTETKAEQTPNEYSDWSSNVLRIT